jgi:hypothetical protein
MGGRSSLGVDWFAAAYDIDRYLDGDQPVGLMVTAQQQPHAPAVLNEAFGRGESRLAAYGLPE